VSEGASALPERTLGDFTADRRLLLLAAIGVVLGLVSAVLAAGLLRLIAFCTNLFFFHRLSVADVSPAGHHLGTLAVAVPVVGGLLIGLIARYGSERIRGHGIPEAIEAILMRGSRVEPTVAVLKPVSAAIAIGAGGLIFPQALGVGTDTIAAMLQGDVPRATLAGILFVKSTIWVIALGSGTSGGVLAPLLMMGGALGGVEAAVLPAFGPGFWPLVSMAAILGGTMRAPFTGVLFAIELTRDFHMVLPLIVAVTTAHAFTVLTLRRSILTEKISRRGYHLTREYEADPLEMLFVREVLRTAVVALPADTTAADARSVTTASTRERRRQHLFPVVDGQDTLVGVVTRHALEQWLTDAPAAARLHTIVARAPVVAHEDEPLRTVAQRMAETGLTRFPVIERGSRRLVGMVSLSDLLKGRRHALDAEHRRERVLALPIRRRARAPGAA